MNVCFFHLFHLQHSVFVFLISIYRYFCPNGSTEAQPKENYCKEGHYCPGGTADQRPCPPNAMANYTHAENCTLCPAGYYCEKAGVPILCEKGSYCPAGTGTNLQACPRGTYGPEKGYQTVQDCKPCDAGRYCNSSGATSSGPNCNKGHWCLFGVDRPDPIGVNKTSGDPHLNSSCPDGRETGYGGKCPAGSYCPEGAKEPEPCEPGFYGPIDGLEFCSECLEGYYCPDSGMTNSTVYECPEGHYCPKGTKYAHERKCDPGTYNDEVRQSSKADCKPCKPGYYCPVPGE